MSLDIIQANRITGQVTIEPSETLFDPVSKFRVSTPSNLIDTDFEYGLQSTKWETLELINNIPTFFAREGVASLSIASMSATTGNNVVTVTTNIEHGLVVGNVIIVKGATLAFADGTYAVLTVPSSTTFTYQAKRQSPVTGDIKDASTEILQGNLYQGTEFKLENLGAITTDGEPTSTITVSTVSPHGFKVGTSFILLNSLTSSQIAFDSKLIEERLFTEKNPIVRTGTHPLSQSLDYRFQTKGEIDAGSGGMISVPISGSEDEGTFAIQFPTDVQFRFFDEAYDRIWVNSNSSIIFTNLTSTTLTGSAFKALRPKIDIFGTGLLGDVDWQLMNLYYLNTVGGLRVRWEGKEVGDPSVSPTLIWEIFFDTQLDAITLSFITVDYTSIAANTFSTVDIYDSNSLISAITLSEFVDDLQRHSKEVYITTAAGDETKPVENGYAINDVDYENFGPFQPYRWDAYKGFQFNLNKEKPTLYFTLSENTPYNSSLFNNTNYIKRIQHNVITFADPHGLEDRRGYLYTPGIANLGLVIGTTAAAGGSATTAPTMFHLRTLGGTTGLRVGEGVYTFTGSTIAISASSATNNRLTIASNATIWIGDTVVIPVGVTTIGGLTAGTVYYVREIIGTTQITLTDTYDETTGPGSVVTLTTQTLATVLHVGAIITDPTRQVVLTDRAAPSAARFVSYGTSTPRLPLARDLYGPHAFIATSRIHYYQPISGNAWIASADTHRSAFDTNQPFVIFTAAPTGSTASTNNYSTAFTPYWSRNPNSNIHTYTGTNRAPGNRDHQTVTNTGSIAAVALNAESITLTVTQANLRDVTTTLGFDAPSSVNITGTGGVGTGDTITIPNHGLITADAIVYNRNGGTLIGGLVDGTIYFAIRLDDNTIRLATTAANANTNTGINLTSVGTGTQIFTTNIAGLIGQYVDITNTALNAVGIRYGIVTAHTGTTTRTITIKLDYAAYIAVAAQNNNCTVTFYGNNATSPFIRYNLSTASNGANLNITGAVYDGYAIPIKYLLPTERTWYSKGHGFQSGDLVRFEVDNTIVPGAYTNASYYVAETVSLDRFRLLTTSSTQIIPTTAIGAYHEFALYDPSPYLESDSKSTNSWLYSTAAVAAGGTSAALSYPAPAYANTTVPVPNANAGSVSFTCSILQASITNVPPNTSGVGVLGARIKFYAVDGADLLLADSSSINDLDIRVGTITGTTTRAIECRVLTPGGLPANLVASSTARIVIDTGLSVREENILATGSSWTERDYNSAEPKFPKNNTYFPTVNAKIADFNESSPFPYTTLYNGRITAVSVAQPIAVTYTFNSNLVNIVSAVRLNNVVTLTTNIPHGFKEGETITVASVTDTGFNGTTFVIKAVSPTTIVYDQTAGNATSANGTVTQTIQAISPKILTISTITSASPAVVTTTATHTLVNGQAFHFQGIAGSPWGSLWDNKVYYIRVVSGTTFQVYKDRALTVPLDTSGNSGTPYVQGTNGGFIWALGLKLDPAPTNHIFNSRSSLLTNDTIFSPGYGLNDGTSVTYTTGGGVAIGGLSGGVTKFIRTAGADRFRLADNSTGWDTAEISISSFTTPASLFTTATQGFTTGRIVQYTCTGSPIVGLQNGGFYYARVPTTTTLNLYWTSNGAINAVAADLVTVFGTLPAGVHRFRQSTIVDLTSEGEGDQHAVTTPTQIGTLDGLYELSNAAPSGDTSKFTLTNPSNSFIPRRTIAISSELSIDLFNDAIFTAGHGLVTGTPVTYNLGVGATAIGTLVDETEYYAIKISDDFFRVADSQFNANSGIALSLRDGNGKGSGSHEFITSSIVGAIKATGIVTANANNTAITGTGTSFASNYRGGDTFYWSYPPVTASITRTCTFVTTTFTNTSAAPFNAAHFLSTGMSVRWNSTGAAPSNLVNQQIYYVRFIAANTFSLHPTYADALANTGTITATGGSGTHSVTILTTGNIGKGQIRYVNSNNRITLFDELERDFRNKLPVTSVTTTSAAPSVVTVNFPFLPPYGSGAVINLSGTGNAELDGNDFVISTVVNNTVTFNAINNLGALTLNNSNTVGIYAYAVSPATYDINSSLLIRADSASVHRPYDGGVEIVATSTPDSKMIRQTRRYFRYQSGKGIQVSFAINFSPTITINNIQGQGATALITTRLPHRLTNGVGITIINEASNNFNGNFNVTNVEDDYSFTITLPTNKFVSATGRPEFFVGTWNDASIRCGLFDDQNGMFFEYDGSTLYCVRRNSTKQLGGSAAVFFGENAVFGTDTKYSSELSPGDYVVIRGQSYKVIEITNNSLFYIQPSYRGVDANNVVISITQDDKVAQQNWSIDPCDGTGPTGYNLNINRIQMAYMDYSWYGAGKVRFGFKDNNGVVRYVHDIIHNNLETEAYLRSGNLPARYEVQTGDAPSFIPNLAHWGTSVIMDGEFQEDKAYLFSVLANPIIATSATSTTTAVTTVRTSNVAESQQFLPAATINGQGSFFAYNTNREIIGEVGYALQVDTHNDLYYTIPANAPLGNTVGTPLRTGTLAVPATSSRVTAQLGASPYLKDVIVGFRTLGNQTVPVRRNLLIINKSPTTNNIAGATVTATLTYDFTQFVPLLSVRLAPSVDNGVATGLGLREIINRMQLTLQSLDVLSTHECEFQLVFNATLDNLNWQSVTSPSLSQVVYHSTSDTITGGSIVYTFLSPSAATQANGVINTAQREFASTTIDLREVATLGNSILGGDGVFPDGPDVVTLRFRYIGLPGLIGTGVVGGAVAPFRIGARLSWAESQA